MSEEKELPQGWCWTRLGDIGTLINGDRGKNYPSKSAFVQAGIPFVNAGHLDAGRIDLSEMNYITEDRFAALNSGKIQPDDILYCLRGSLGKAAIVNGIERGAIASSLAIIRIGDEGCIKYLYYFLVGPTGMDEIRRYDNGSAQPNLSAASVTQFRVPVAPLPEQKRIVDKLDTILARVDACRERLDCIPAILKRFRQSVLAAASSGKLTEEWREENVVRSTAVQPDVVDEEDLPKGWHWSCAEQIKTTDRYSLAIGPFGSNLKVSDYRTEGTPLVFVKEIRTESFGGPNAK